MLVLGMSKGKTIYIGDDIKVTMLTHPTTGQVKIGIDAPKDVPVHREAVYERIQAEQKGAK